MSAPETTRVLLVGAGGHARMCLEPLRQQAEIVVVGAVSHDGTGIESLGTTVLGLDVDLEKIALRESVNAFCVAIGNNVRREYFGRKLTESGRTLTQSISRSAVVSPTAELGAGAQLMPAAVVNAAATIGVGTIVNTNSSVDHDCRIGVYAHIAPGVAIGGGVTIGDRVLIGLGARVLPGVTIGSDAVVGAGAVVTGDVAAGTTVVGNPARPIESAQPR